MQSQHSAASKHAAVSAGQSTVSEEGVLVVARASCTVVKSAAPIMARNAEVF